MTTDSNDSSTTTHKHIYVWNRFRCGKSTRLNFDRHGVHKVYYSSGWALRTMSAQYETAVQRTTRFILLGLFWSATPIFRGKAPWKVPLVYQWACESIIIQLFTVCMCSPYSLYFDTWTCWYFVACGPRRDLPWESPPCLSARASYTVRRDFSACMVWMILFAWLIFLALMHCAYTKKVHVRGPKK